MSAFQLWGALENATGKEDNRFLYLEVRRIRSTDPFGGCLVDFPVVIAEYLGFAKS